MRKVEFNAGYYEWNIFLDGECVYSCGDLADFFEAGDSAEEVVEVLIDAIAEYFKGEQKEYPLTDEETEYLKKIMIEKLHYQYVA